MRRLLIPFVAAAAIALPASALAWGGGGGDEQSGTHFGFFAEHHHFGNFAKLSGAGTSFGAATATATGSIVAGNDHPNGHFSVSLTTTWSAATTKTFTDEDNDSDSGTVTISWAPATASVTLSNGTTSTTSLTGKTCSKTRNGTTKYGFFGASADHTVRAFLKEDGSIVKGLVFSGGEGFFHH